MKYFTKQNSCKRSTQRYTLLIVPNAYYVSNAGICLSLNFVLGLFSLFQRYGTTKKWRFHQKKTSLSSLTTWRKPSIETQNSPEQPWNNKWNKVNYLFNRVLALFIITIVYIIIILVIIKTSEYIHNTIVI